MQIPILNGIYADATADFRTSYPVNLVPVPKTQGISQGYLRPADGIVKQGDGPGADRGGVNWRGECYRIMGSAFVRVEASGAITVLGYVANDGKLATFDYSFDRLGIASSNALYYWNGSTLTQVTDPDLGAVIDLLWVDGYFMTTDGEFLVVTELTDPTAVNPLKYGSSEADPDEVKGLLKLRNEVYALNRYTVEVFENVGGNLFPFQRIEGAIIPRGIIGTHAACVFDDKIAFLGSAKNEPVAVWIGINGDCAKISTREVDEILQGYEEQDLADVLLESRIDKGHTHLYVHLPDRTLVYDLAATQILSEPVWFTLSSGIEGVARYRARNLIWAHERWMVADPTGTAYGYLDGSTSTHYGDLVGWEFGTAVLYNEGRGAIIHELELVALPGRVAAGKDPVIWTSYSVDGETWSVERAAKCGKQGERNKRINWLQQGAMRHWRIQKFRGNSDAHLSFARLEARLEALNV